MDDQSTDNSRQLLEKWQKEYPQIIKIFQNPEKGGNKARNFGYQQASGSYIQWLDSDDRLLPGKLKAQVNFLEQNPKTDVVYSDWKMDFYSEGILERTQTIDYGPFKDFLYELIKDNWTVPCNYLLRKSFADQLANGVGWNTQTVVGQDREYFTKMAILGAKFSYVPGVFSVYNRWSSSTVSGMPFDKRLEHCYKLESHFKDLILKSNWIGNSEKKRLVKILNAQAVLAKYYHPSLELTSPIDWKAISWKNIPWKIRYLLMLRYAIYNQKSS